MNYTFGDSDLAARRLAVLARVYEASTREFLERAAPREIGRAGDLGCGPGFTTQLIAEALAPERAIGLERSEAFIEIARKNAGAASGDASRGAAARRGAKIEFQECDVTRAPLPEAPYDLLFCRFLLAHLADAGRVIRMWGAQLAPGGLLLIEEVERIETEALPFARYLGIVAAMLRANGSELFIGPELAKFAPGAGLQIVSSEVARLVVADADAATMFAMNIPNWRQNAFVKANHGEDEIAELAAQLEVLRGAPAAQSRIEWSLRQVVIQAEA